MTAAIIGFIGVIAGSLITAWFDRRAERSRRRAEARVASQLIASEIANAVIEIESALEGETWWSGELPTKQWKDNAAALAAVANPELIAVLADVYLQIEAWERTRVEEGPELSPASRTELEGHQKELEFFAEKTRNAVGWEPTNPIVKRILPVAKRAAGIVVALAVVLGAVALVYAAFVPREEVTDSSIAAALERELPGDGEIASCSHRADRWLCNVSYPNRTSACQANRSNLRPVALPVEWSTAGDRPCPRAKTANPPTSFQVAIGDERPVATPRPNRIPQNKRAERIQTRARELGMDKKSLVEGVVNLIKGE